MCLAVRPSENCEYAKGEIGRGGMRGQGTNGWMDGERMDGCDFGVDALF